MCKYSLLAALLFLSAGAKAQDIWERPDTDEPKVESKAEKEGNKKEGVKIIKNAEYLSGAVPEVDGKVAWSFSHDVPGASAQTIYNEALNRMKKFTTGINQLEDSRVALVNKKEHTIVVTVSEWLVFQETFLSLDRANFHYNLIINCTDGHFSASMERLYYIYDDNNGKGKYKILAEESINDKNALNKKKTKLVPGWAKFRKKTVDRAKEVGAFFGKMAAGLKTQHAKQTMNADNEGGAQAGETNK